MSIKLADFNKAFIIKRYTAIEAGWVNDPNDLGKETNHGITIALATEYKGELVKRFGWDGTMRNLSKAMAFWLYEVEFWNKMLLDRVLAIHPLIADKMFDVGINAGKSRAVSHLQEFLNVNNNEGKLYVDLIVDGGMGNKTFDALASYIKVRGTQGLKVLLHCLIGRQTAHYWDISVGRVKNERFTFGWFVRSYDSAEEYQRLGFLYT